eukprot:2801159-Lingulodinium_polyedra.AAC.1
MHQQLQRLLYANRGRAILSSKSCDGTPMSVIQREASQLPSGAWVRTRGRAAHEFLVKLQFVRALGPHEHQSCVVMEEAVALQYGKSARAIAAVCLKDWKTLREQGHSGIAIEHLCTDRMGHTALVRMLHQHHLHKQESYGHLLQPGLSEEVLNSSEWLVATPCAAHDAQNSFRWAMHDLFKDKALLRDCYISIESIRNSWDL